MLVSCSKCKHQYDVGQLAPGSQLLCHCGVHVEVPEVRRRPSLVAHCGSCGASVDRGATTCGYCGSGISVADDRVGNVCPECFHPLLKGAKFCSGCGIAIAAESVHLVQTDMGCPRCEGGTLKRRQVHHGSIGECMKCGGVWLGQDLLDTLIEKKERLPVIPGLDPPETAELTVKDVRYLACPICKELMHRKNFARRSGVVVDWCKGHGFWFDRFELDQVLDYVAKGGLERSRELEAREREREAQRRAAARTDPGMARHGDIPGFSTPTTSSSGVDVFEILEGVARFVGGFFTR